MAQITIEKVANGLRMRIYSPGRLTRLTCRANTVYEAAARIVSAAASLEQMMRLRKVLREQGIDWYYELEPGSTSRISNDFGPDLLVPQGWASDTLGFWRNGIRVSRRLVTSPDGNRAVVQETAIRPGNFRTHAAVPVFHPGQAEQLMKEGLKVKHITWWKE